MVDKIKILPGQIYAVTTGTYIGCNMVIIRKNDQNVDILNLPDMKNMSVPINEIINGMNNNILELLETLPDDIMNVCKKQHEKNINTGQQQSTL